MRVKPQGVETYFGGGGTEKGWYLAAVHGVWSGMIVVGADGGIRGSIMTSEVDVSACCGDNWIPICETSFFHGGGFSSYWVPLGAKEEGDSPGSKEFEFWDVMRYDAASVMELHILVPKLDGPAVGRCLCIFNRTAGRRRGQFG